MNEERCRELRQAAITIYFAADQGVAAEISWRLLDAASEIERLSDLVIENGPIGGSAGAGDRGAGGDDSVALTGSMATGLTGLNLR